MLLNFCKLTDIWVFFQLALEFDSPHVFLSCGEDALVYGIDLRQDKPNK
jgi:hypothetical protein